MPVKFSKFCLIDLCCNTCSKVRKQSIFYRHSNGRDSGVSSDRRCNICVYYHRKHAGKKTFDEYESEFLLRLRKTNLARSSDSGFVCARCNEDYNTSDKGASKSYCQPCCMFNRSAYRRKLRLSKWGCDNEEEYIAARLRSKIDLLSDRLIGINQRSSDRFSATATRYWFKYAASDEWIEAYYLLLGKPWNNVRLTESQAYKLRYKIDSSFNLKERMRRQLRKSSSGKYIADLMRPALNRNGTSPIVRDLLGYSVSTLRAHLESQFVDGMSWELFRQGRIHIDHIKPRCLFDLSDQTEWYECWSLSNLQPLWAEDNLKKSSKYG